MRSVRGAGANPSLDHAGSLRADVSAIFQAEHAAILGFYAARIEAARRGASPAAIFAAIRALIDEQMVALRNLANRRHAAERQEAEKSPDRPDPVRRAARGLEAT